jgi:hypothetical protein
LFPIGLGLCAVLVETVNWLAFTLFWFVFAALFTRMRLSQPPLAWLDRLLRFGVHMAGGSAFADGRTYRRYIRRTLGIGIFAALMTNWLLPAIIGTVFLVLFASANPVIEHWLLMIDLHNVSWLLTPRRIAFWFCAGVLIWGALRAGSIQPSAESAALSVSTEAPVLSFLFSRGGVTRSLVIANLLFLAQNVLDTNFLWAGAALPDGITYAEYAHRGAYPLVLTALLAAAFILITMRPAGGLSGDWVIRTLIYLWLAQNLALVMSSIWRTQLYVVQYSLTYLRLSALLWMGLVIIGLLLIVVRMMLDKSSGWLIRANLIAAFALLLAVCPLDLGRFIASYNVAHSREMGGGAYDLDLAYLRVIGPSALPALLAAEQQLDPARSLHTVLAPLPLLRKTSADLLAILESECADWRGWTFRAYRLCREVERPPHSEKR